MKTGSRAVYYVWYCRIKKRIQPNHSIVSGVNQSCVVKKVISDFASSACMSPVDFHQLDTYSSDAAPGQLLVVSPPPPFSISADRHGNRPPSHGARVTCTAAKSTPWSVQTLRLGCPNFSQSHISKIPSARRTLPHRQRQPQLTDLSSPRQQPEPIPPKWVAYAPRPSRSPPRSSSSGTTPSSPWTSRPTSASAMRSPSSLPSACATRSGRYAPLPTEGARPRIHENAGHRDLGNSGEGNC